MKEILARPHDERDVASLLAASGSLGSGNHQNGDKAVKGFLIGIGVLVLVIAIAAGWLIAQATGQKKGIASAGRKSGGGAKGVVGEPIRDGQFEYRTGELSCGNPTANQGNYTQIADGQFCILPVTVENIGNQPRVLLSGLQSAHLDNGDKVGLDEAAMEELYGELVLPVTITSGEKLELTFLFDLPVGVSITELELHDSPLSKGATLTVR
ncbi:MAG: DUF4352 domain-containing protein [Corynebacteriales bacterium]|nr:DUF4352 domain-containing protein [Mycobacteriales bacterium]